MTRESARVTRDLRDTGIAGVLGDLVATGEPVLAVTAYAPQRARVLADRVGGFSLTSWSALEDAPELADRFVHLVAIDPPTRHTVLSGEGWTHLAWGTSELDFALRIHEWDFALRDPLTAVYRALRESGRAAVRRSSICSGVRVRNRGPRHWRAAWCGCSRSSSSPASIGKGRPSRWPRTRSAPRSSARAA